MYVGIEGAHFWEWQKIHHAGGDVVDEDRPAANGKPARPWHHRPACGRNVTSGCGRCHDRAANLVASQSCRGGAGADTSCPYVQADRSGADAVDRPDHGRILV